MFLSCDECVSGALAVILKLRTVVRWILAGALMRCVDSVSWCPVLTASVMC